MTMQFPKSCNNRIGLYYEERVNNKYRTIILPTNSSKLTNVPALKVSFDL